MTRPRGIQLVWCAAAIGFLGAAGLLQRPLDVRMETHELVSPGDEVARNYPWIALMTTAGGGLRAPLVSHLWIRTNELKEQGRYYDAMQMADLICKLQPRHDGVWSWHSWNMAWNISVTKQTPEERWLWVHNGLRLLRDEGIPLNPRSVTLYKELGWLFYSKMGQEVDNMHMAYKQRWAARMHRLLASPPMGDTADVIDAFRPIADAPLDKRRSGGAERIQSEQVKVLLDDPAVAKYADLLAGHDIAVDESFLEAYNRYSLDDVVDAARVAPVKPETPSDRALSQLINDPRHAWARGRILAFIRAQVLWNVYRMDPQWMVDLMEKYGPLDWRTVWAHGLYWTTYGTHICETIGLEDINSLNTGRIVLSCLKDLSFKGRLRYSRNPGKPDEPTISQSADWRFIDATHQEHLNLIEAYLETAEQKDFAQNPYRSGHMNYLIHAMGMLYASYRREKAEFYFDFLKDTYHLSGTGDEWDMLLEDFIIFRLNRDGDPIPEVVVSQMTAALDVAYLHLGYGDTAGYADGVRYARRIYNASQADAPQRMKLPPFKVLAQGELADMLVHPISRGFPIPLVDRSRMYVSVDAEMQLAVYDWVARYLRPQCSSHGLDFDKAFPAPEGLKAYRARRRAQAGRRPSGG